MQQMKLFGVMLMCGGLVACATAEPPKTVSDACPSFRAITFAELPAGRIDDPGNKADTSDTVREIMSHNARWDALCAAPHTQRR